MSSKPIRTPGPDHPITVEQNPRRVVVKLGDRIVADSGNALTLREANYPPVHYIPRADADMTLLTPSAHQTYCPYKGDASYLGTPELPNSVWSYQNPYPAVAAIAGHLAFYPDRFAISLE